MSEYTLPEITGTIEAITLVPLAPIVGQRLEFVENDIRSFALLTRQNEQLTRLIAQLNSVGRAVNAARAAAGLPIYYDMQGADRGSPEYLAAFTETEIIAGDEANARRLVVDHIAPSGDAPLSETWIIERTSDGVRFAGPLVSSFAATLADSED